MELDHIFICVKPGALEAEALISFGLTEGSANKHPGQGTANRRFFFANAYVELLYLQDSVEAQSEETRETSLYERLEGSNGDASPFGVCFRPGKSAEKEPPFAHFAYQPLYLPADEQLSIGVAPLIEPLWVFSSLFSKLKMVEQQNHRAFEHSKGLKEITSVQIILPAANLSEAAVAANELANVEVIGGEEHLLILGFDYELLGCSHDFRPELPLKLSW